MLHAEHAHAHSTNRGRAFLSFSFSLSLSGPVWPGLKLDIFLSVFKRTQIRAFLFSFYCLSGAPRLCFLTFPSNEKNNYFTDLYANSLIISSGLLPFSSYTVYIKAWNEIGAGQETSISVTSGQSGESCFGYYNIMKGNSISKTTCTTFFVL